MQITKDAVAGTLESNDVLVRVSVAEDLQVDLTSSVMAQFGDQIRALADETLQRLGVQAGRIIIDDKGALDCTLRARIEAAVARGTGQQLDWRTL